MTVAWRGSPSHQHGTGVDGTHWLIPTLGGHWDYRLCRCGSVVSGYESEDAAKRAALRFYRQKREVVS